MVKKQTTLFCVALSAEARCLIDWYQLKRLALHAPVVVYANQDQSIFLLQFGVGMARAAVSLGFVMGAFADRQDWVVINLGIAGSGQWPVGVSMMPTTLTDVLTGEVWYPQPVKMKTDIVRGELSSFNHPNNNYALKGAYDMEAAGVMRSMLAFISREQIIIYKIISDHSLVDQAQINKEQVLSLIRSKRSDIDCLLDYATRIHGLLPARVDDQLLSQLIQRHHYTLTQIRQLTELLRRSQVICPALDIIKLAERRDSATEVIAALQQALTMHEGV